MVAQRILPPPSPPPFPPAWNKQYNNGVHDPPPDIISNMSDIESVDPEVKELIKGRESLTFGSDAGCTHIVEEPLIEDQQLQNTVTSEDSNLPSATSSSTSINEVGFNQTRLMDQYGNVFTLHPNGFVTPFKQATGHIGGMGYTNHFHYHQQQQQQQQHHASHQNRHYPFSQNTIAMSSSARHFNHSALSSSMSSINSPYRRQLQKFRNLASQSSKASSRLYLFQNHILKQAQFCGDLDLGTSNRYGDVDSTSIIINSSSANTSSRSSYRNSLRSSSRNCTSSRGTKSPPSSNNDDIKEVDEEEDEDDDNEREEDGEPDEDHEQREQRKQLVDRELNAVKPVVSAPRPVSAPVPMPVPMSVPVPASMPVSVPVPASVPVPPPISSIVNGASQWVPMPMPQDAYSNAIVVDDEDADVDENPELEQAGFCR